MPPEALVQLNRLAQLGRVRSRFTTKGLVAHLEVQMFGGAPWSAGRVRFNVATGEGSKQELAARFLDLHREEVGAILDKSFKPVVFMTTEASAYRVRHGVRVYVGKEHAPILASMGGCVAVDSEGFNQRRHAFNAECLHPRSAQWVQFFDAGKRVALVLLFGPCEAQIASFLGSEGTRKLFWGASEDLSRLPRVANAVDVQTAFARKRSLAPGTTLGLATALGQTLFPTATVQKSPEASASAGAFYNGFLRESLTAAHVEYMFADVLFISLMWSQVKP